ncbi:MAG TPA: DUF1499 domain-containing protein [Stellaceae bacterium]|nr:DUF1499 domain-containing protein [Stellaceae bacterium]
MMDLATTPAARSPTPVLATAAAGLGAAAILVLLGGPLGYRIGLWPLPLALGLLPRVAVYLGAAAVLVGALGLLSSLFGRRRLWALVALAGMLVGGVSAYAPLRFRAIGRSLPPINDITTDTENPPQFQALMPLRAAAHAEPIVHNAEVARLQKSAYPDIAPLTLALTPDRALVLAVAQANRMGWTIINIDAAHGRLEATDRTLWYGFTDDIVVRVAADEGSGGARIDIRSKSRVGRGDFGANARRVRNYLAAVKGAGSLN